MFHLQSKSFLRAAVVVLAVGSSISPNLARSQTRQRVTGGAQSSTPVSVRQLAVLAGHTKEISEIAFSPEGEMLATGSLDSTVRLWSVSTGETKAVLALAEKQELNGLLWSYDGRRLMTFSRRGSSNTIQLRIWEAKTGKLKATIEPHYKNFLTDYEWSPDGRVVLTASEDGTVDLWDAETGRLEKTLAQAPLRAGETKSFLTSLFSYKNYADLRLTHGYFDSAGQSILTLSYNHSPKLWDAASGKLKNNLPLTEEDPNSRYPSYPVQALFSPDRRLVARHDDDGVWLLDTTTGLVRYSLGRIGEPLAFSPDGQSLLIVRREAEDELKLYDIETGYLQLSFEKVPAGVHEIYWSPDGGHIITTGVGETKTRLLDAHTGRVVARLPYGGCTSDSLWGSGGCEPFGFSADGRITLKQKNPLKLWSTETGELLATMDAANGFARFSPTDKRVLVTRAKDKKTALLWDVSIQ